MKKSLWIFAVMILFSLGFAPQQSRTITGKVTSDDDGNGIPGVNVLVKGTKNGTFTDAQGKYSITLSSHGGTLIFSFVGYETKEVKIGTSNVINVTLSPDIIALEEVVTTGHSRHERKYRKDSAAPASKLYMQYEAEDYQQPQWNTEEYDGIEENIFREALEESAVDFFDRCGRRLVQQREKIH